MNKPNLYAYIAILFVIVIFLSLAVWLLQQRKNISPSTESTDLVQPTPTTIETRTTPSASDENPATSTGVLEEKLPKNLQDLSDQKQALKLIMPLSETYFSITFDYGEDKFIVELKEPKTDSEIKFKEWLTSNYPAIPLDRFMIK